MKTAGIQWQQRKLTSYDAALTEFDKPALSGVMSPDHSGGSFTVIYVSPMRDTNFDALLLAYLLLGSYATLFWLRRQRQR